MTGTEDKVNKRDDRLALTGLWSALGLTLTLFAITRIGGVHYWEIVSEMFKLFSGNIDVVPTGDQTLLASLLEVIAVVLMTLLFAIVLGAIFSRGAKSYDLESLEKLLDKGPWALFLTVVLEELFTRGLFLGILTQILTGERWFYALFLLGNGLWAFAHTRNFQDSKDRSPFRVLPQFVAGFSFTYIFVRHGIVAAIFAHYLYDVIVVSLRKEKMPSKATVLTLGYYIAVGFVFWSAMKWRNLTFFDLSPWVNGDMVPLDDYHFIDYLILLVTVDCIVAIVACLLLLDPVDLEKTILDKIKDRNIIAFSAVVSMIAAGTAGLILLGNWLLSFMIGSVTIRAIVLTIFQTLQSRTSSGSSLARVTIVTLPAVFLAVSAFTVLGFWPAFGLSMTFFLVNWIPSYLNSDVEPVE